MFSPWVWGDYTKMEYNHNKKLCKFMFKFTFFYDTIQSMKTRIIIFSSLLCLCGANVATASECIGPGCYSITPAQNSGPLVLSMGAAHSAPESMRAQMPKYIYPEPEPLREVKLLSIKPVPSDDRPPVWDGTIGEYDPRGYDKTVDWRDGVPIWDDFIPSYKYKDYTDWFLQPMPELYIRESDSPYEPVATVVAENPMKKDEISIVDLYKQNMADAAATRARVEELLRPKKPTENLWVNNETIDETETVTETCDATTSDASEQIADDAETIAKIQRQWLYPDSASDVKTVTMEQNVTTIDTAPVQHINIPAPVQKIPLPAPRPEYTAQDLTELVTITFGRSDGCPFESETECEIWRRKPIIRETVSPRSPRIRADKMDEFINAARCNENITANNPVAAPLLERYKMLMSSANACCTDGMAYSLKQAGASDGLVYKFLADDANFYGFGARCLMMTDNELDEKYPNTATAAVAADVRNGCLCRGRQWFRAMLAPFEQAYAEFPEFKNYKFNYTYVDGLQREITVSVNNDVQNVLKQLSVCP